MTAHALFIGTNHYTDRSVPPLHCAQRDASELYHLFKRELGYGEHAHLLEAPKQEDVFQALDDIGQQVRAGDSFLLYFAGHGVEAADGQDQYLLLGGARMLLLHSAQGTPAGTLSVRDLVTLSDAWPQVQRVMVFDACRTRLVPTMGLDSAVQGLPVFGSEQVLQQIATRDLGLHRRRPAAAAPAAARGALPPVFIKSCQSNQLAVELLARQRSMFGLAFDEVLQDARRAGQAVLANDGLLTALAQRMARLAEAHGVGGGQQPWMSEAPQPALLYVPARTQTATPGRATPPAQTEVAHGEAPGGTAKSAQPQPQSGLDSLVNAFERQLATGQLDWPPEDCCVATLARLGSAGLAEPGLSRYRALLMQARQARQPTDVGTGAEATQKASATSVDTHPPADPQRAAKHWPAVGVGGVLVAAVSAWVVWGGGKLERTPEVQISEAAAAAAPVASGVTPLEPAGEASAAESGAAPALRVQRYPLLDDLPIAKLQALQAQAAQVAGVSVAFQDRLANGQPGPKMVVVPEGQFRMGSDADDTDEKPVKHRQVPAFAVMQTEVTVAQYLACVDAGACAQPEWREPGSKYHHLTGSENHYRNLGEALTAPDHPVVGVSWQNAGQYAAWLSSQTKQAYRRLSEAEWEMAARAGSTARWSFGDDEAQLAQHAWFNANSGGKTHAVGSKLPNAWGLFDLHGNVWEWVQDCYHTNYSAAPEGAQAWETDCADSRRVVRGGSWNRDPWNLRSADRFGDAPGRRSHGIGFRLARTL